MPHRSRPHRRSPTEGLEQYNVGAKVRRLRLKKKISLEDLGRHTGLSPALLSKLERNRVMPTLPTLNRVAMVFGVSLDAFFTADGPGAHVVRAKDRIKLPERQGDAHSAYDFESLDYPANGRRLNAYLAEFRPAATPPRQHAHPAAEVLFVLSGRLAVRVDESDHELAAGDSIYIEPHVSHGYVRVGDEPCRAVVVTDAAEDAAPPVRSGRSAGL